MAVFYASKAYALGHSAALAHEFAGSGITVTTLCPGPTRYGFQQRAAMRAARIVSGGLVLAASAAAVARVGCRAMLAGLGVVIPGLLNRLMTWSVRLVPAGRRGCQRPCDRAVRGLKGCLAAQLAEVVLNRGEVEHIGVLGAEVEEIRLVRRCCPIADRLAHHHRDEPMLAAVDGARADAAAR